VIRDKEADRRDGAAAWAAPGAYMPLAGLQETMFFCVSLFEGIMEIAAVLIPLDDCVDS
jgi:hypothetical protein